MSLDIEWQEARTDDPFGIVDFDAYESIQGSDGTVVAFESVRAAMEYMFYARVPVGFRVMRFSEIRAELGRRAL